jgi:hypothetical protein
MSRPADLNTLKALFAEAAALNREALQALRQGEGLDALQSVFERKTALVDELNALQGVLGRSRPEGSQEALQAAFQAQREAATTEAQLAESLGKIVPQSGNAARAYDSIKAPKPVSKLDSSV